MLLPSKFIPQLPTDFIGPAANVAVRCNRKAEEAFASEHRITSESEFLFASVEIHIPVILLRHKTRRKRIKELVGHVINARASCIGVWERLAEIEDRDKLWLDIAARTRNLTTQAMLDYAIRRLQYRWLRRHLPSLICAASQ